MRASPQRHRNLGFTAIESVIAIFILSCVGLVIGETFLRTGRSAVKSREAQSAAALSAMVLEQYTAYAAADYSNLTSYDKQNVTPQAFFGTKDNLGYDNLRISTRTLKKDTGGSTVTVEISWGTGPSAGSQVFTKSFAETTGERNTTPLSGI